MEDSRAEQPGFRFVQDFQRTTVPRIVPQLACFAQNGFRIKVRKQKIQFVGYLLRRKEARMRISQRKNFTEQCLHFGRAMSVIDVGKREGRREKRRVSRAGYSLGEFPLINQTSVSRT